MREFPHRLTREVVIRADRPTVFRFFTDSERFARWWGAGSTIDPQPGGAVCIRYPNAVVVLGTIERFVPDQSIVFSYGYEGGRHGLPPGQSRVTVSLFDHADGTRLELLHEFTTESLRDQHDPGWRYQLAVFANVVCAESDPRHGELVDAFFGAWNETRAAERHATLQSVVTGDVEFRDAFAALSGLEDLHRHIAAIHVHMAGTRLEREGQARLCQGRALVDWVGRRADGAAAGRGTNLFEFAASGRIRRIVGFWRGS